MNLENLQEFLDTAKIPEFKQQPKTFLEIANQPHYENVISSIYAFYFDPEEEHGLGDLFINSLVRCINRKHESERLTNFTNFDIYTEYPTKKGRIDILLKNDDVAIIIENKIYHHLKNDLGEYSEYIQRHVNKDDAVFGLVIGLKEISSNQDNFISLTHKEFLNEVLQNIGEYLLEASDKYVTFLKDLYQNIINLSEKIMKNNELEFYLTHQEKITNLVILKNHYKKYIKSEVDKVCGMIEGLKPYTLRSGSSLEERLRYFESESVKDLFFTIEFSGLLNSELSLFLIIELQNNSLKHFQSNFSKLGQYEIQPEIKINQSIENTNRKWYHLASTELFLKKDDLNNLSEVIYNNLLV